MKETKRLVAEDDVDDDVRAALLSERWMAPRDGARRRVWAALGSRVAIGGVGGVAGAAGISQEALRIAPHAAAGGPDGGAGAGAAAKVGGLAGVKALALKGGLLAVLVVSGASIALSAVTGPVGGAAAPVAPTNAPSARARTGQPTPRERPPRLDDDARNPAPPDVSAVSSASARPAPPRRALASPSSAARAAPPPPASEAPAAADAPDPLLEESQLLLDARTALRDGRAATCLALLESARVRFPAGAMGEERESLHVEALFKSGRRDEAVRHLASFRARHPNSPQLARLSAMGAP